MAWRHPRSSLRVVVYDIEGDEAAFRAFMEELSHGLIWSEPDTLSQPLGRYFQRKLLIAKVPMRSGGDPDEVYEVRPLDPDDSEQPA